MKSYTVRAGKRRFRPVHIFNMIRKRVDYTVIFRHDCQYDIGKDQTDWNKLPGISGLLIHWNSYRFGWRYNNGRIELAAYWYEDGVDLDRHVADAQFDLPVRLMIRQEGEFIVWRVDRKKVHEVRGKLPCIGFRTNIYFGGNWKAPHEMTIDMV